MSFFLQEILLPSSVALATSLFILHFRNRSSELREIQTDIRKMIELSMLYPHVEDKNFTSEWDSKEKYTEKELIYDNYCCFVFNLLERIWKFQKGNRKKINYLLHVDEVICDHKKWWYVERDNIDGYVDGFKLFANRILTRS